MIMLSIGKTVAPALLVGAASVAAVGYAVTQMPRWERVESGPVGAMSQPSAPAPAASNPASAAITADKSAPKNETPALASADSKIAALSADLGVSPPPAPAAEPSVPAFDIARVEAGGDAVIAGRAAPGATVDLMRNGERLDQAVADASGQFVMVPSHLPSGSYELTLSAKMADGTVALSKQGVAVTVKEADTSKATIMARAENAPQAAVPAQKPQDAAAPGPRQAMAAASAADDSASAAKSAPASGTTRIVARGDSLWRISRIAYGAGEQYAVVYRANRDRIRDPNLIRPGQVLVVPLKHR